jgi:starch synthase
LSKQYPTQIVSYIGFDDGLARRIFAGSDFFLMPSRFEPCGLSQQYALRYGSIPIARNTGGLSDTITPFKNDGKRANGFLFNLPDSQELAEVIHRSRELYQDQKAFYKIRENALKSSFSWALAAEQYEKTYEWALGK